MTKTAEPPGRIGTIYIGSCSIEDPHAMQNCRLIDKGYVWPDTALQFMPFPKVYSDSQFFNKVTQSKCMNVSDTLLTRLNAGRKCLDTV